VAPACPCSRHDTGRRPRPAAAAARRRRRIEMHSAVDTAVTTFVFIAFFPCRGQSFGCASCRISIFTSMFEADKVSYLQPVWKIQERYSGLALRCRATKLESTTSDNCNKQEQLSWGSLDAGQAPLKGKDLHDLVEFQDWAVSLLLLLPASFQQVVITRLPHGPSDRDLPAGRPGPRPTGLKPPTVAGCSGPI
jgi:hypothetical protein